MAKSKPSAFSWSQPVCDECHPKIKLKTGRVHPDFPKSTCCFCNQPMVAGDTYVIRLNPGTVPYPTIRKDEE